MQLNRYSVFYHFSKRGETVEPEGNVVMNEADIYTQLLGKLESNGDYFGLIDSKNTTAQVMYKEDTDQYWLEVIDEEREGAYGNFFSFDEIADLFKALLVTFSNNSFPRLEFHSWEDLK